MYDDYRTCFDCFVDGVFSPMREHTDSYGSSAMSPLDSVSRQSAGTIGISNITPLRSDLSSLKNVCYFIYTDSCQIVPEFCIIQN